MTRTAIRLRFLKTLSIVAIGFAAVSAVPAFASADADAEEVCTDCKDTTGEHTANDTNDYCWRLGLVALPDAQGQCAAGWAKRTIGQQIVATNRHVDKCDVAAAIAEPPFCEGDCIGDSSITSRQVTATSCTIKKKRDCEPIRNECTADPQPVAEVAESIGN